MNAAQVNLVHKAAAGGVYDFVVVGAGIAGLACAELLQRSGRRVLLVDRERKVCGGASAQQQGWFHTGALYAALPSRAYFRQLIGNLDDLFNYYAGFPGMNLASGRYLLTRNSAGWFGNRTSFYFYVSPADPSVPPWQKPLWWLAVLRAQSRLSWLETVDFTRELSPQVTALTLTPRLTRSLARRRFDFELGPIAKVMKSRDRTLDATRIATDLLNAFLASGGDLRTNAPVVRLERGWVHTTGESFRCRQVIAAAGRHTAEVAGIPVKVMKSPVLVVTPALSDINFIRMTPNVMESLNHLCHDGPDGDYSVIANAHYWPAEAAVDPALTKTALLSKVEHVFGERIEPRRAALYFGDKTELIEGSRLRNYQYQILEGRRAVVVLPGKMSLAFSLAVNLCRHFGIDPATHVDAFKDLRAAAYVAPAVHLEHSRTLAQPDDTPGSPVHLAGVG